MILIVDSVSYCQSSDIIDDFVQLRLNRFQKLTHLELSVSQIVVEDISLLSHILHLSVSVKNERTNRDELINVGLGKRTQVNEFETE